MHTQLLTYILQLVTVSDIINVCRDIGRFLPHKKLPKRTDKKKQSIVC